MGTSLDQHNRPTLHAAEVIHHGEKMVLPEGMDLDDAISLLNRRKEYLSETCEFSETINVFPWDGAIALNAVLARRFGWVAGKWTGGGFFDPPKPPQMISVDTAYGEKQQVPWGAFQLPGTSVTVSCGYAHEEGRFVFSLKVNCLRADEATARTVLSEVREELRTNSIYRGKAVALRFRDNDGDALPMPEIKFIDTDIRREDLILSRHVEAAIETNLFAPIQRHADLAANGIPFKRGVLLAGFYGTGKTMAAKVASRLAVDTGITYLYVRSADELPDAIHFAKQYQSPGCVIFCEDIDRVMDGERDADMDDVLNIIDGIDTKNTRVLVVLTTNNLEGIHQAMLRPGRLDAVIEVTPPDGEAVTRLLRAYGGEAIAADAKLDAVGKVLAGQIPAVVAEVVKRAKLAELRRLPAGERVTELSVDALLEAAETMKRQVALINRVDEEPRPTVDSLLEDTFKRALNGTKERVEAIHDHVVS